MDLEILKKKISTYRTEAGRVRNVSDELLVEILLAWEQWTAPADGFYKALGVSRNGISSIIGKAKKLRREGFPTDGFKEIKIAGSEAVAGISSGSPCQGIEISWENGKLIRFQQVEQLVEFLKKAA
jgi:hypothetical protein